MRSVSARRLTVMAVMLAAGQLWSLPRTDSLTGPVWFYESAPGFWRSGGSVSLTWNGAATPPSLTLQDGGKTVSILYLGATAAAARLCEGQRAPLRWFTGAGREPAKTAESGNCLEAPGLWPGITLRLSGDSGRLKADYLVEPGADPAQIRFRYQTAVRVRTSRTGELLVETPDGLWREDAPRAWLEGGEPVDAAFVVAADGTVGFSARPAPGKRMVIDPAISYSGVFGGNGTSSATSITVGAAGAIYAGGFTDASDFPMNGSILPRGGGVDGVVFKIDGATGALLWANYVGGPGDDRVHAITLGADGGLYAAGATTSAGFPTAGGAAVSNRGGSDAFLLKFSPDGTRLEFSTCLGGSAADQAFALARSAIGVWIGGQTSSTNFPMAGGPPQSTLRGVSDAFLARFSPGGALEFSTYLGGSGEEMIRAIAVSPTGDPVVGGSTGSSDLPLPVGAYQTSLRGALDGFVLRLSAATGQILAGTYLGGGAGTAGAPERVEAVAVDSAQNVYAVGFTPSNDFPTPNAWLGTLGGVRDGFLVKLHPGLNGVAWGTLLGGGGQEIAQAIALLPDGRVAVGGSTTSVNFPLQDPVIPAYRGSTDGFVTVFTPDGTSVPFSTYLGGSSSDAICCLAPGPGGAVIAAGQSGSLDLPLRGLAAPPAGSALRVFVTRIALGPAPVVQSVTPAAGAGAQAVFEVAVSHPAGAAQIGSVELAFGDLLGGGPNCRIVWSATAAKAWVSAEPGFAASPVTPGAGGVSAGAFCTLSGPGSSAAASGDSVILRLNVAFPRGFAGPRPIAANATSTSGAQAGFSLAGVWQVPESGNAAPSVVSVTASPPGGQSAVFSAVATDPDGSGDIARVRLLVGPSMSEAGACAAEFDRQAGVFRLANDSASGWHAAPAGSAATLANSFCQLRVSGSAATAQESSLRVDFDLAFSATSAGPQTVYALAVDASGSQTNYRPFGTFQIHAAANAAPVFVSLTPASGSGAVHSFTLTYADANGAQDIAVFGVRIHSIAQDAGGCSFEVDRMLNELRLRDNSGNAWLSSPLGTAGGVANSQCEVRPASISVATETTQARLSVTVTFFAAFNGGRTVWTRAADLGGANSGWIQAGGYSVAAAVPQAPVALAVSPSSGSGPAVTLSVVVSDANGALDISTARVLIHSQQTAAGGCYVAFHRPSLQVSLASDSGAAWTQAAAGAQTVLANSQCSVHAAGVLFAISGANLQVTLPITFKPAFNGAKQIWANGTDAGGLTSASPLLGTFTVAAPVNLPPAPASVSPSSGSGPAQVFAAAWTDPNGAADILRAEVLIHSAQTASWGCYLQVRPAQGIVALASDDGQTWMPVAGGSAGSASNSQCTLRGSGTSVQVSGLTLTAMLDLAFHPAFNGVKSIWANALDQSGLFSPSPLLGSYTVAVPAPQPPVPVQAAPSAGSGAGQVFQFVWTDANGANDITWARVLINSSQQAANGCYFALNREDASVLLADDSGDLRLKVRLGVNESVSNTSCSIHGAGSSLQAVGSTLSLYADVRFRPAFNGFKRIWMNATDRSGFTSASPQVGTYDVFSNAASAPAPAGVAPSAASGNRQAFTFSWRDANGAQDIAYARVLIHSAQQASQGCYLQIDTAASRLWLADDAGAGTTSVSLGAAQTAENSQCRIHGSTSWMSRNGDTLTAIVDIAFKPSFAGLKAIWMNATDMGGLTSPSPQTGSYTVTP